MKLAVAHAHVHSAVTTAHTSVSSLLQETQDAILTNPTNLEGKGEQFSTRDAFHCHLSPVFVILHHWQIYKQARDGSLAVIVPEFILPPKPNPKAPFSQMKGCNRHEVSTLEVVTNNHNVWVQETSSGSTTWHSNRQYPCAHSIHVH